MKPNPSSTPTPVPVRPGALPRLSAWFLALAALAVFAAPPQTQADPRRFTYSYETLTYVPGNFEFETWTTWEPGDDGDAFAFRHELEYAVSERLRFDLYLADWQYSDAAGAQFDNVGLAAIYNLTNPNTDWLGSSLYGEIKGGEELLALEGKILLQKNFGPFALVYNGILEAEWEGEDLHESKGGIGHTLGAGYMFNQSFGVGVEMLTEVEIEEWSEFGEHAVYLGPNATFRKGNFWATFTGLWELTETEESDFQLRAIVGIDF